jgi:hypothetical protein
MAVWGEERRGEYAINNDEGMSLSNGGHGHF